MTIKTIPLIGFNALTVLTLLSASTLLAGCGGADATSKESNEELVISVPVEAGALHIGDISSNYTTTAVLEAKEEAYVVARASGIIEHIYVEEGDYVKKGQVLAQLEPERYRLNLARAKADLVGIEKELAKIDKVYNKKLVSDDTYDKISAQYASTKATLSLAELDLKEATIVAPISGYIATRNAKVGNLTESFQRAQMFHIVEQNQLYGVVYLPEKELSRVHKDQAATLTLSALQDSKVDAFVERISPVIDPATGTFKVTLRVPNDEHLLKVGMFAHVDLNYDTHQQAALMPRKAMLSIDNKINVFVVTDGIAHKQEIRIGYQEGDYVEILSGLSGDEHVVITGHQNLKDQAPVEIVNPEALLLQAQSHEQAISNTPQQNENNASLNANHTS
ncbi:efflux RND transporter periplasmic adaptor subunit [Paraglaciecola chathamensis]|uniref:RND transporter MFP subunit n=1 Tax=Paraglaciecola chathamensis TaxID=368405 RepID=A0A8H9IHN5_9ALTE|nr:efflux RND transporter periplasmic adaptor subunit [Paraglaciecola oceanifecundans]GGZ68581.1 RND transporter MFP subunit [Paraglaciecola oceanifecundans]